MDDPHAVTKVQRPDDEAEPPFAAPGKLISEAARRALQEAALRRAADAGANEARVSPEQGGPAGLEPTRFGDWERKGLAIDF